MPRHRPGSIDYRAVIYAVGVTEDDVDAAEAALRSWCAQSHLEIASVIRDCDCDAVEPTERHGLVDAVLAVARYRTGVLVVQRAGDIGPAAEFAVTVGVLQSRDARLQIVEAGRSQEGPLGLGVSAAGPLDAAETLQRVEHRLREAERALGRKHVGQVPFGWRLGVAGDLVQAVDELMAIDTAVRLHREGVAVSAIAEALQSAGYEPPGRGRGLPSVGEAGAWTVEVVEALICMALAARSRAW